MTKGEQEIPHIHTKSSTMIESYLSSPLVKSFLAGSFSGTCSTILFQPLDLVKTRLQSPLALGNKSGGMMTVALNVVKNERVLGLWKGVAPSLTRTVPSIGVYFSCLHYMRSNFGSSDPGPLESIFMGVSARSVAGLSMLPFTVVKTRFESGQFQYRGVIQALVSIYKGEGLKGLFSGTSATLLRDAPFSGLYLMFYTQTKKAVKNCNMFLDPNLPAIHFACGVVAGCLASMVTQPADVVKTQMQINPQRFGSVRVTVLHILQLDGPVGFLRGIVPRTMRRTLMAAMAWTVYEQIMAVVLK